MTRATPATLITELRETGYQPVTLIEIETGDVGTPWIRLTSDESDQVWPTTTGSTFTARPFGITEVALDSSRSEGIQLECADADDYFKDWLATTDFVKKKLKRYTVDRGALTSTSDAILDVFRITNRSRQGETFTFHAEPLGAILARLTMPAKSLTREDFPGIQRLGGDR